MTGAKAQSGSESHLSPWDSGIVGGKMAALETTGSDGTVVTLRADVGGALVSFIPVIITESQSEQKIHSAVCLFLNAGVTFSDRTVAFIGSKQKHPI